MLALQDFGGALIVVSHDRSLLESTTDAFWLVAGGKVQPFDGDLEDYRQWRLQQQADNGKAPGSAASDGVNRKEQKRLEADARNKLAAQRKPLQTKQNKLDKDMATLNSEKAELDAFLLLEEAYQEHNKARLAAALKRQGELSAQLEEMEMAWLELQEAMEALGA
jgi:ATP-binding cassette subfamily F protein 3